MKNNYIIIEEMRKELAECERKDRENDINGLLCRLVKFLLQKEYYFLLELIYPWEWIETGTISRAGLVVAKEPYTEGFLLVKTIPMEEILKNSISIVEEVSFNQKMAYIKEILNKIPVFD